MNKYHSISVTAPGLALSIRMPITVSSGGKSIKIMAVWDTGATGTCISERVANDLQLVPISKSMHNTANGPKECNDFIVDINMLDNIIIKDVRISDFAGGPGVDALIGMDIITMGDLSITNARGQTVMSFRIPPDPINHIDYVKIQNKENKAAMDLKHFNKKMKKRAK